MVDGWGASCQGSNPTRNEFGSRLASRLKGLIRGPEITELEPEALTVQAMDGISMF